MSGTVIGHQMFTIEQIELIRRLRNSGITKEQVAQAFESMDRLDRELGMLYNVPTTSVNTPSPAASSNTIGNTNSSNLNFRTSTSAPQRIMALETDNGQTPQQSGPSQHVQQQQTGMTQHVQQQQRQTQHLQQHQFRQQLQHQQQQGYHDQQLQQQPGQVTLSYNQTTQQTHKSNHIGALHAALMEGQQSVVDFTERGIKRNHTETIDLDSIESPASFEDENSNISAVNSTKEEDSDYLVREEHGKLATEIKSFINQYDIKKDIITNMSGQSIAVIDQFLQGDYQDIPEKSFQSICVWYLSYRTSIANGIQSKSPICIQYPQRLKFPDGQEVLIPPQRRERFTFREKHLEILEKSFKDNAYPSQEQRESIANMCNMAISNNGTRHLLEREKVTPHIILNWFANRRKEVKKIAREEGISTSSVVLPSRLSKNKAGIMELEYSDNISQGVELPNLQQSDFDQAESTENTIDSIENIVVFKQEFPD